VTASDPNTPYTVYMTQTFINLCPNGWLQMSRRFRRMDRRRFINTVVQSSVIAGGFVTIPQLNIGDKIDGR